MKRSRLLVLVISLVLVLSMLLVASGCGTQAEEPKEEEPQASEPAKEEEKETAAWPQKPIEMTVPYSPGGGSDRLGRFIVKVIEQNNLLPEPIQVVNKPGGSGSVGSTYVAQNPGDAYKILTFITGQMTAPMTGMGTYSWRDFTPIARLALDEFLLLVHKDSPYQSLEEVLEAAKQKPGEFTVGGTALGAEDNMVVGMLENAAGVDFNYIPFDSGGEVNTNLMGKQIDSGIFNPNEAIGAIESGDFRPLVVFREERLKDLPDVPTAKELGYDVTFQMFRGVVGPKDMPEEAVKTMQEVLKKVSEDADWQENYIKRNMLTSAYLPGEEFGAYMAKIEPGLIDVLKAIGVYKGK